MRLKSFLPLALTLFLPAAAHADQVYTFTFSGADTDSFSFTYAEPDQIFYNGRPRYLLFNDFTLTFDGFTTGGSALAPEGGGIDLYFDDPRTGNYDFVTFGGTGIYDTIETGCGSYDINTCNATLNLGDTTLYENGNPGILNISTPTQTPEPTTLTLLGTGLLGLGVTLRRRLTA